MHIFGQFFCGFEATKRKMKFLCYVAWSVMSFIFGFNNNNDNNNKEQGNSIDAFSP